MPNVSGSTPRAVRASEELWEAVDKRAERDDVSVSDVVRSALIAYLGDDAKGIKPVTGREDGRAVRSGRTAKK